MEEQEGPGESVAEQFVAFRAVLKAFSRDSCSGEPVPVSGNIFLFVSGLAANGPVWDAQALGGNGLWGCNGTQMTRL
eukprot:2164198-Amphidinium_carterae.1